MAASLASYRQLSRGGAPEWWPSGAWDPKLLIARGCAQLQSTLQSSSSGSRAPARRVRGAARARVARVRGARAGVPAAARAFARTVQYRGEASMPNGTKSRERHRSFSRYGTSTRSACTGTDRIYVASTSRQVEFTSHLQVLNVAFTPKIYVAHATRCELSSKGTVVADYGTSTV